MINPRLLKIIFKSSLYFALVSCNTHSKIEKPPETIVLNEKKSEPQASSEMNYIQTIVSHTQMEEKNQDPSIQLIRSSEKNKNFSTLVFHDIPGKSPYRLEFRRIVQNDPNLFFDILPSLKKGDSYGVQLKVN
jgi:hypothetical protein